jgi:hypothetical protein
MIRYYLVNVVPVVRGGVEVPNSQTAEYFGVPQAGVEAAYMSFGNEGTMLVCADTDAATHAIFAALPRVIQLPADLDQNLSAGAVNTVEAALEARNIPAHWVSTSLTYRQVLRVVAGMFQFAQVYHAQHTLNLFRGGVNLNTRVNQIPQAERNRLSSAAQTAGLDTSGITGTTTVRQILRSLGEQWLERPVYLGSGVI